ncbi:hypothetical protein P0E66_13070 [Enterococcus faecalis]|uniref:hypothetical protein n=1 Tax=Enterococcus faecalis TaxID=1351 RepID=UPI001A9706B7|nr:hypothetical protein [Enterococcus faecalis]MBO1137169.1 hypothetical protein [Enterococcus faecalis]MDN3202057.1 hypothetical protein [Enterococcus faecalis]
MNTLQNLLMKTTFVLGKTTPQDASSKIVSGIQWLIAGGGLLMAIWGIVQLTQSGRQGDAQGKMEGSWLLVGGVLLLALGGGTLITGVFTNPPGL